MTAIDPHDVVDLLGSLIHKSLVVAEDVNGQMRYRLLESIRQYSLERLQSSGESSVIRDKHRDHFLRFGEDAGPKASGSEQKLWMDRLDTEHDNLRLALARCLTSADGSEKGLRLSGALWRFWISRGHWSEGLDHLERALAADPSLGPSAARAVALRGAGAVATSLGDFPKAKARFEESLRLFQELGDEQGTAQALQSLGFVARNQGDYAAAQAQHEECLRVFEHMNDRGGVAWTHLQLGYVAFDSGDSATAQVHNDQALRLFRELEDKRGEANALVAGGTIDRSEGKHEAARERFQQALGVFEDLRDRRGVAWSLISIGYVDSFLSERSSSRSRIGEGIKIFKELGDKDGTAYALELLAETWLVDDDRHAVRLRGAAAALRHDIGAPIPFNEMTRLDQVVEQARSRLGDTEFESAWDEGHELDWTEATGLALDRVGVAL